MQICGNRVMVVPDDQKTETPGGLILPPTAQEESQIGTVTAIGDGGYHEKTGRWMPITSVEVGARVLYSRYGGTEIDLDDGSVGLLLNPKDIFAIIGE